jgi:hypothetical protein
MGLLKKYSLFKINFILSLIIISLVILASQVRAAQSVNSVNNVTKDISSPLYFKATDGSGQEKSGALDAENNKGKVLSPTREVRIPLHNHLKAFFSFGIPAGIRNLYEQQHDTIYRAMFGIHIAL